jgi:hypothetical protein
MIEITNVCKHPVQVVIKSKKKVNSFTTLNIPGLGSKKNIYNLEDERSTAYIERVEKMGLIKTRYVPNNILTEGEK